MEKKRAGEKGLHHTRGTSPVLAGILILLAFFTPMAYPQDNTVTVAAFNYFPYHIADSQEGISTELIAAVFQAAGLKADIRIYPVNRRNHLFHELEVDAHSPGRMHIEKDKVQETETVMIYSINFCFVHYIPNLAQKDADLLQNFSNITELNFLKAVTMKNSITAAFLEKNKFNVHYMEKPQQTVLFVQSDRAQVSSLVDISALLMAKANFPIEESVKFNVSKPIMSSWAGIAFRRNHPRFDFLLEKTKAGLEIIKKNGTYLNILKSYYGEDNIPRSVLLDDMKSFGKERIDIKKFMNFKRNANGKII